jgi:hypothetical protein
VAPAPPAVPIDALDAGGWELVEETTETVFEVPTNQIHAATQRYEDTHTRTALREAAGLDRTVRFFAATRLVFEPPPPPGITPRLAAPTLRAEVRREFTDRLRERGLQNVDRAGSQRVRVADRRRARLTKYTATDPLADVGDGASTAQSLPLECWVAVWTRSKTARVVTGGYPAVTLAEQFAIDAGSHTDGPLARTRDQFRDEFLDLLRAVE